MRQLSRVNGSHETFITVINDGGSVTNADAQGLCDCYIRYEANHGKKGYYKMLQKGYASIRETEFNYFIQLPDDYEVPSGFYSKAIAAWEGIKDADKVTLALDCHPVRMKTPNWTGVASKLVTFCNRDYYLSQWMDLCYITDRHKFAKIEIPDIDKKRWEKNELLGSGVGRGVSLALLKKGLNMYHVDKSIVVTKMNESVMNPLERKVNNFFAEKTLSTAVGKNGKTFILTAHKDHIGKQINKTKDFYEAKMLEFISERLPKYGVMVDVGANIGNHTVYLSHCCDKVLSIEPQADNFALLKHNVENNEIEGKVDCRNVAVTDKKEKCRMSKNEQNMGMCKVEPDQAGETITMTLDELCDDVENITLLKIDCEGQEMNALRGGKKTILKHRPHIFIETQTQEDFEKVHDYLLPMRYFPVQRFNSTATWYFMPIQEKITVGIASIPTRKTALKKTIMSIKPYVDQINVYLNNCWETEQYLDDDKIKVFESRHTGDYGDAGKFYQPSYTGYNLHIDDDLLYPINYVGSLISQIERFNRQAAVSYHGRILFSNPINSYYKDAFRKFKCLEEVKEDQWVQVCGTGVLGYHSSTIVPMISDFIRPNMADIWFSIKCQKLEIPLFVPAHEKRWIKEAVKADGNDIYSNHFNDDGAQTKAINSTHWVIHAI